MSAYEGEQIIFGLLGTWLFCLGLHFVMEWKGHDI
jgi:hypothetical protein